MLEAHDTIASSGFDCGGTSEDDAVCVMMFVAAERGKEGNIHEQVQNALLITFTACLRVDAVQVALLERCLAIYERKFGPKSYECVEALDRLAGNHNRGCGVVHHVAAVVGFCDGVFAASADENYGCVFVGA